MHPLPFLQFLNFKGNKNESTAKMGAVESCTTQYFTSVIFGDVIFDLSKVGP